MYNRASDEWRVSVMKENPHVMPQFSSANGLEFGLYTLGEHVPNPHTGKKISAQNRIKQIIEMAELAEQAGMDIFQLGESHQEHFISQAHFIILAAIAQATSRIKLGSSATIISTLDPVRAFEDAATIDLLSNGRMELVAGRASRTGLYDLLGYNKEDYEALFEEKIELLLRINENEQVNWSGKFRAPLKEADILPRPNRPEKGLPIWRAVGNSLASSQKAGSIGLPMYQAHLGGAASVYQNRITKFRQAASEAGYDPTSIPVTTAGFFYVREKTLDAYREYYPHIDAGMKLTNGHGFSKRAFAQGQDVRSVVNVGDPELVIEKILYQHELFKHQRYVAQIDSGGVSMDDIKRTIDIIGNKILPKIKQYTKDK